MPIVFTFDLPPRETSEERFVRSILERRDIIIDPRLDPDPRIDPAPMLATTPTGAMAGKIQAPLELRAGKRRGGSGPKGATRR